MEAPDKDGKVQSVELASGELRCKKQNGSAWGKLRWKERDGSARK